MRTNDLDVYTVLAYDGSVLGEPFTECFRKEYTDLDEANDAAKRAADCVADVYGRSYVELLDENGDVLDYYEGDYAANKDKNGLKDL